MKLFVEIWGKNESGRTVWSKISVNFPNEGAIMEIWRKSESGGMFLEEISVIFPNEGAIMEILWKKGDKHFDLIFWFKK